MDVNKDWIQVRVEKIENGYILKYHSAGQPERVRFAESLQAAGEQLTVIGVEVKLRGAETK